MDEYKISNVRFTILVNKTYVAACNMHNLYIIFIVKYLEYECGEFYELIIVFETSFSSSFHLKF